MLRAGLGMLPGMLELMPNARVGHWITAGRAHAWPRSITPSCEGPGYSYVLLIDPMLATAGALAALDMLTRAGAGICASSASSPLLKGSRRGKCLPDGADLHAGVDRELNAQKFIVPGLGDFGDRLFGTI